MIKEWAIWSVDTRGWCEDNEKNICVFKSKSEGERCLFQDFVFPMEYEIRPYVPDREQNKQKKRKLVVKDLAEVLGS